MKFATLNKFKPSEALVTSSPANFTSIYSVSSFLSAEHINVLYFFGRERPMFSNIDTNSEPQAEQMGCYCLLAFPLAYVLICCDTQASVKKIQREEIINMLVYGNVTAASEWMSVTATHYANRTETNSQRLLAARRVCVRI